MRPGDDPKAAFSIPQDVAVDKTGSIYVADRQNMRIRLVDMTRGTVSTFAGGTIGFKDGTRFASRFSVPGGVALDPSGKVVYVADEGNNRIRMIKANQVSTLAGTGTRGTRDGAGKAAQFSSPQRIAVHRSGRVYVWDSGGHTVRMITP